jgi:hypothetical protein
VAQTLREILDAREREVRRSLDDIQKRQIDPLQKELSDIMAARSAINGVNQLAFSDLSPDVLDRYKRMKYEDLAIFALRAGFPNGATIQELLDYIHVNFGREISQGSFSPILSRLRQKGTLAKDGHAWVLSLDL